MHIVGSMGGEVLDYLALECATDQLLGGKRYNNSYTR